MLTSVLVEELEISLAIQMLTASTLWVAFLARVDLGLEETAVLVTVRALCIEVELCHCCNVFSQ